MVFYHTNRNLTRTALIWLLVAYRRVQQAVWGFGKAWLVSAQELINWTLWITHSPSQVNQDTGHPPLASSSSWPQYQALPSQNTHSFSPYMGIPGMLMHSGPIWSCSASKRYVLLPTWKAQLQPNLSLKTGWGKVPTGYLITYLSLLAPELLTALFPTEVLTVALSHEHKVYSD